MDKVHTTLGLVNESELDVQFVRQPDGVNCWVMALECKYKGIMHPEAVGEIVRRDVWVTPKGPQVLELAAGTSS